MGGAQSAIAHDNWRQECAKQFLCNAGGLVDSFGQPISPNCDQNNLSMIPPVVWGVSAAACDEKCGSDKMFQAITFKGNAITLSTWLFPFIALIAQLPFEARGSSSNFLSGCMALGSPAMVAYSLCLTVLNRRYMSRRFAMLKQSARSKKLPAHVTEMIEDAAFVISQVRQAPVRASNRDGWLTSLVRLEGNQKFWRSVAKELRKSSRGFTYSFFAQASFAFIAYLFSFVSAYIQSLGVALIGLQFSTSMVWSWMFPIVIGYVLVRSQMGAGAIDDALEKRALLKIGGTIPPKKTLQMGLCQFSPRSFREEEDGDATESDSETDPTQPTPDSLPVVQNHYQLNSLGVLPSTSSSPADPIAVTSPTRPAPSPTTSPSSPAISNSGMIQGASTPLLSSHDTEDGPSPTWLGLDVQGDEVVEGPIFNYARVFTWYQLERHIYQAFRDSIDALDPKKPVTRTARERKLRIFGPFSSIDSPIYYDMFWASVMAILLQWATTGAAIFTAYKTPVVGLGCHSGSYLLYGVVATFCWVVFVISNILSHAVMVWYDKPSNTKRTPPASIRVVTALAVCFRILARGLVIANAGWLITFSVLEDLGYFQNCWCGTLRMVVPKSKGWINIFPQAKLSESVASELWIGGFILPIAVSSIMLLFISFTRKPTKL